MHSYFHIKAECRPEQVPALVLFFCSVSALLYFVITPAIKMHEGSVLFMEERENTEAVMLFAAASPPLKLTIETLGIEAPFETPVALDATGVIGVPRAYNTVAWYKLGPSPGEIGPAVVLGHVDSKDGPAVFYSLGQLTEGDTIEILREDGKTLTFKVTGMERIEQAQFPSERVYGTIPFAGLRLITCSGTYDRSEGRYSHNLIVYAELLSVSE